MKIPLLALVLSFPLMAVASQQENNDLNGFISSKHYSEWIDSDARILIDTSVKTVWVKSSDHILEFPVAVGKSSTLTPNGNYSVQQKTKNPWWIPTADIRAEHERRGKKLPMSVKPGPNNPLGAYLIRFNGAYAMHGTNDPKSIGKAVSHGCVRLKNDAISEIFPLVDVGDGVWIRGSKEKTNRNGLIAKKQVSDKIVETLPDDKNLVFASEVKEEKEAGKMF